MTEMDQAAGDPVRRSRPAPRGTASYQRKRAVKACQVCRARRTKCDNLKPSCSFCLKVGAVCIQSAQDLSSFDPASLKILERLDSLEQLMRSSLPAPDEQGPPAKKRALSTPSRVEPPDTGDSGNRVDVSMVLPPGSEEMLSWSCLRDLHATGQSDESADDIGALGLQQVTPQQHVSSPPGLAGVPEEPRLVKALLDNFFNYVHVKNPILDEVSTRRMVLGKAVEGLGFDWSPESCLALLICALGSLATPFGPSADTMPGTAAYAHAHAYFQAAQKRMGLLFVAEDIIAPQCFFLAGVFMMCNFQSTKAWRYFVQALVGCQEFEFLSNASGRPDQLDDTPHQAIYWSAWKSEREVRGNVRRPDFPVSDHDTRLYPSFFPTPPAPRADAIRLPLMEADQSREQISWYFYLAEISLRRLSARVSAEMVTIMETHASRHTFLESMAAALPSYEAQATEWQASLPPCLSLEAPAEQDDVCRFVLRGHLINLYETIYWPFLAVFLDEDGLGGPQTSTWNAFSEQAQRGLENHMARLLVNKAGYRHRHHGTDPLPRSCSRSALTLLAASRSQQAIVGEPGHAQILHLPHDWRTEISNVVDLLVFWGPETNRYNEIRKILCRGLAEAESNDYRLERT
ncbi:uncharacterized protein B0I36DRAFT_376882 [Microdochium trichocladiopsis]|uniref:Zn(2)-C6 fungal-type domain-containing protein n=1 Tax=Microdochium trichocladiopsis TaxID=1682393 RepID=A0A9P8Y1U9_9PEZI|nr:uncharacterized protein B0I36DRAFT_376882 [Microdochium trichocladiopsis]KAH7025282.1 hypothetical protein B0I36DRAFT_376882 [Microdochium trichocladiopsis]